MIDHEDAYAINRRNWDERVAVHLAGGMYDLDDLRTGRGRLMAIEERELAAWIGSLEGMRVIHLQCHFGKDTLSLAQRGAEVVGVDFSPAAIETARSLAIELGLDGRARFVECNVYDAPEAVAEPASFDLAYITWGALYWLPDIRRWAEVAASFLKPGGALYLLEGHPTALVLDDEIATADGRPGWFVPYFERAPLVFDDPSDYANPDAKLQNSRNVAWMHGIGDVVNALVGVGLEIERLNEHDAVAWAMFKMLVEGEDGMHRWPDRPWFPLAYSVWARRRAG